MIFGTADQAFLQHVRSTRCIRELRGEVPESVAGYAKGSRYEALQMPALLWVYATLIESAVIAYECVLPPLSRKNANATTRSQVLAGLFGLPGTALAEGLERIRGLRCRDVRVGGARGERTGAIHGATNHDRSGLMDSRSALVPGAHRRVAARAFS